MNGYEGGNKKIVRID